MNQKVERNSSIEALKIFAVVIIVFSHAMPVNATEFAGWMNLNLATESIQRLLIVFMKYGGQIGNAIFVVCSAWFLVDSVKLNSKKIILIIMDCFVISVVSMMIFMAFGIELTTKEIIKQFFPLFFQNNWFVCCYICYYMLHPLLNSITQKMSQKSLLYGTMIMTLVYCCMNTVRGGVFYGTDLMGFITIHFIVKYLKKHMLKICENFKLNVFMLLGSGAGIAVLILLTNYLGLHISFFSNELMHWSTYKNPLILLFALSLFNLCNSRVWYNKYVNYLSGLSLLIYIIHENDVIRDHVKAMAFAYIFETYTYQNELAWVCLSGIILLLYGTFFAILYKNTIQRITAKLAVKMKNKMHYIIEQLMDVIVKL